MDKEKILDAIEEIVMINHCTSENARTLAHLWSLYYQQVGHRPVISDRAETLGLLGENFLITDANIQIKTVDQDLVRSIADHLKEVLRRKEEGVVSGIRLDEAKLLLDWSLSNTWLGIRQLGLDVEHNSLNGLCELTQIASLLPFERLGLPVTKNLAEECFHSPTHHCFGSVCFPIEDDITHFVSDVRFLVDASYKQFFSASRCHDGMYLHYDEDLGDYSKPDPGFFIESSEEKEFASSLIENGYVLANESNMKCYADGFRLSSYSKDELEEARKELALRDGSLDIAILEQKNGNYSMDQSELEGYAFCIDVPCSSSKKKSY